MAELIYSIVIPVYKNEESLPELTQKLDQVRSQLKGPLEVVFVVDGSPDQSHVLLRKLLPQCRFESQLILLSRNFGSFAAIRAGLEAARGKFFAVIAADLQEPIDLPVRFFERLETGEADVVVGQRNRREDPFFSLLGSKLFWWLYRKWIQREMPPGGIDVFGCNSWVRNELVQLQESNSTLVGLLLWVGFRRESMGYDRLRRPYGKSAWSLRRKIRYLLDSSFAFSDLPIRLLSLLGVTGLLASFVLGCIVLVSKVTGNIPVPGYSATMIGVLFFGGVNSLGLGILGEYLWRTFENTKRRPNYIVFKKDHFPIGTTSK